MSLTIAIDAIGGDHGVLSVIPGLRRVLKKHRANFLLFGDKDVIETALINYVDVRECATIIHSDICITSDTKPMVAIRSGTNSHMGMAIQAVHEGRAQAVVSAGNTGAYMALSKIILGTLKGIHRPAIPAIMPTITDKTVMLDLGANLDCTVQHLVQFALMGSAFAAIAFEKANPSVGLLNVGSEEMKGHATVQEAFQILKNIPHLNFKGFVEGDDILKGTTDVIVTDGFSGNIALKSIEGTSRFVKDVLSSHLSSSLRGKVGYLLAKPIFEKIKQKIDPRLYNGAVFLGLQQVAVKSHGSADALSFANAVEVAIQMVQGNFIEKIAQSLEIPDLAI